DGFGMRKYCPSRPNGINDDPATFSENVVQNMVRHPCVSRRPADMFGDGGSNQSNACIRNSVFGYLHPRTHGHDVHCAEVAQALHSMWWLIVRSQPRSSSIV